ncbi:coq1 putative hexaprenyl diphosphate synthase [Tilletia horrida]|uniref:(2E,6E)-farnesyl diphosphate synthase n=1 Tax=Tilletia horrida TaxID=155126 RepID=A0AAN6JH28_9BASI|nr:coq1 putative hexaprenyl diphosphate synthase [Tilletia horrida]
MAASSSSACFMHGLARSRVGRRGPSIVTSTPAFSTASTAHSAASHASSAASTSRSRTVPSTVAVAAAKMYARRGAFASTRSLPPPVGARYQSTKPAAAAAATVPRDRRVDGDGIGAPSVGPSAPSASLSSFASASPSSSSASPPPLPHIDPLRMIKTELASLRSSVSRLLGSGHPALDTIAKYYFQAEGKHIRPQIVLLMARATNGLSPLWPQIQQRAQTEPEMSIGTPISPPHVLNDHNPHAAPGSSAAAATSGPPSPSAVLLPTQRRLAEITEMIHVASLLHDDVIDEAALRRSAPSAPASFGNKLSILAGDFLLGRASVALARLRDNEVVELLATVIANLVEGEVMQLKGAPSAVAASGTEQGSDGQDEEVRESLAAFEQAIYATEGSGSAAASAGSPLSSFLTFDPLAPLPSSGSVSYPSGGPTREQFAHYLQKTYLKTASLIGKSARAATILGGCGAEAVDRFLDLLHPASTVKTESQVEQGRERCREVRDAAYWFGRNLGMAFQLVDDLLDFRTTSNMFGKPSGGADLRLGLATAPVLYAWQELGGESGLGQMVGRKFEGEGDVEKALRLVLSSQALQRTAWLAEHYAEQARTALDVLPPSDAKDALITLTRQVTSRMK